VRVVETEERQAGILRSGGPMPGMVDTLHRVGVMEGRRRRGGERRREEGKEIKLAHPE
jgi:hypothetical protein